MRDFWYLLLLFGFVFSCTGGNSRLNSGTFENRTERIETLQREIKSFSDIKDAEFELFNINGFHDQFFSIPGASAWDYRFVIKVDTADVFKWREGMTEVATGAYDIGWTKDIIQHRKQNWQTTDEPRYYVRAGDNVIMIIFYRDGIIFKRVIAE